MNEPNDPKLKLAMVRMLPHLLAVNKDGEVCWFPFNYRIVLETEWLYIVSLVEGELTVAQSYAYYETVRIEIARGMNDRGETCHGLPCHDMAFTSANFNTRATALIRVLEPKATP